MIRYSLRCNQGHQFEGWFRSSEGYDSQRAAGQVTCSICGSTEVEKVLMAPNVATSRDARPDLHTPADPREQEIEKMRREIEANSDYVGMSFAAEARAMHEGLTPERAIHGEARPDDARKLIEDGVPVMPLPFRNRHRTN